MSILEDAPESPDPPSSTFCWVCHPAQVAFSHLTQLEHFRPSERCIQTPAGYHAAKSESKCKYHYERSVTFVNYRIIIHKSLIVSASKKSYPKQRFQSSHMQAVFRSVTAADGRLGPHGCISTVSGSCLSQPKSTSTEAGPPVPVP